ncbi:50S ribosomal protein L17 [Eggerthellaceae bacterium PR-HUZ602407-17]
MRHNYKGRKLGTDSSHTRAMKRSLVGALLANDRIKTIESRAKEIRPDVDRIITWAKKGDLHSRRLAIARLGGDKELVREVFEKVAQGLFADRNGGYTRIMKLGNRKGDNAPMVIIELVTEPVHKQEKGAAKKATPRKATRKAAEADVKGASEIAKTVTESTAAAEASKDADTQAAANEKVAQASEQSASATEAKAADEKPASKKAADSAEKKADK